MTQLPAIAVTVGDPSGIGPEIAVKACRDPRVRATCRPTIYGPTTPEELASYPVGVVNAESGHRAHDEVVRAAKDARAGRVEAIATAPINKAAFAAAGLAWRGHTDLLAHLCGVDEATMMFWSEPLRVVLATVHLPLAQVAAALTPERVRRTIRVTAQALQRFGIEHPRIAVAGLNPHAGENGLLGREELDTLIPTIAAERDAGINVTGPFPGDTVFVRASRGEFDVVIACYHDQGLIPIKLLAFGHAVNVTLGLPIIRTSVDHGTAFDIARLDKADAGSMVEAILLAAQLCGARASAPPITNNKSVNNQFP